MSSRLSRNAPQQDGDEAKVSPWLTRRSMAGHVALVIWIPGCVVATYWQVGIALSGDSLGWVYSVMWPCFAVFGVVFWWYLVHDDPDSVGARGLRRAAARVASPHSSGPQAMVPMAEAAAAESTNAENPPTTGGAPGEDPEADRLARAEEGDPELAAYNEYLASLSEHGKTWRRR